MNIMLLLTGKIYHDHITGLIFQVHRQILYALDSSLSGNNTGYSYSHQDAALYIPTIALAGHTGFMEFLFCISKMFS